MLAIKRLVVVIFVFSFTVLCHAQELWVGKDGTIRNADTRALTVGPDEMYLATRNEVYRSAGEPEKWESVFAVPSGENEINCVAGRGYDLFVGTRRGLYQSADHGRTWRQVFKTIVPEKSDVLWVEPAWRDQAKVMIGTRRGVFLSEDNGSRWRDVSGPMKNMQVDCIACAKSEVYASGSGGVYGKSDPQGEWERIVVRGADTEAPEPEESGISDSEESEAVAITSIATKGARVYTSDGKKIRYSDDGGKAWSAFSSDGISGSITCILPSKTTEKIYCATTKGVFEFSADKKAWRELYRGMDKAISVRRIVFDKEGEKSLWAVSDSGVYKFEGGKFLEIEQIDVEQASRNISIIYDNEPSFRDLQSAAMKFAEVDPGKISKWRTQARLKALVPKISVGIDNDSSNTYEIYTSTTRNFVVEGPPDVSSGFDVSISWELGDMIWSDDQTSIDVRSRLTTQLRNDILDDLRRVYYERKRMQFEIISKPSTDMKMRFEKELRIQELTQAIDDLTGSYFSDHMKGQKKEGVD